MIAASRFSLAMPLCCTRICSCDFGADKRSVWKSLFIIRQWVRRDRTHRIAACSERGVYMTSFNVVLFEGFETLDAFGPAEIMGRMPDDYKMGFYSPDGGIMVSAQNVRVETSPFAAMDVGGILLIPGGMGTRKLVGDAGYLDCLKAFAKKARFVLTVCTGSALLAAAGMLDGRRATTNKIAFDWVRSVRPEVNWQKKARWAVDGNIYTSSGVSAGMDMVLGFVGDLHGNERAREIARYIEYCWNEHMDDDPFAL